ncbi:MAG: type I-C CRISPR-associated protein Cas8c/Csd1 [Clostridiales bacterium]|nr:type I-C CRISPR-associated protein Cas8c/Csd1 [Clostridiales bacterium]
MGLMAQAYNTYCAMEKQYVGVYGEAKEPLVPVSHQIAKADLEITLDSEGNLLDARQVDPKEATTIIPVTEQSAGRTGDTCCAHPLCDQLRFFSPRYPAKYEAYLTQLHRWEGSPYSHPKLSAIAGYVEKGSILEDMSRLGLISLDEKGMPTKEKLLVRWRVEAGTEGNVAACWQDRTLFQAFIDYYAAGQKSDPVYCMVSGKNALPANQHPKKIINICANAKLISANDTSGFTYRGRFQTDAQAMTMSYEASQKIHSALHWLSANQGVAIGGRTFLCWNPQGIEIPKPQAAFLRGNTANQVKYSDYRKALSDTLRGWKETIPADAGAVIAAFDAATSGRLALTYYSELPASDFLERLHNWDALCCWNRDPFGIQAPSLYQIANCAFGTVRTSGNQTKLESDDRILRQQVQRLLSCRVDKGKLPADIARAAAAKASNLQIMDTQLRETVLSTACAVLRKYYYDWDREEWNMSLEPEKKDISYQYGRLLAVFEKIEQDTYDKDEQREPNAIRMQSVFAKRPRYASRILWEQMKKAYYPRLKPWNRVKYDRLIGEIIEQISNLPQAEHEEALKDTYLFGYYLQKKALYTSDKTENSQEEE